MNMLSMGSGKASLAFIMAMALASGIEMPYSLRKPEKDFKKCLLHSCINESQHNGGYCCAEHLKRHKIVTLKLKKIGLRKSGGRFISTGIFK